MTGITSPITEAWLALPSSTRTAAETLCGPNRPVTWSEVLLLVARGMEAERERCAVTEPTAYLHEITEPDGKSGSCLSRSPENPWSHWLERHKAECTYKCTPLFAPPAPLPATQEEE